MKKKEAEDLVQKYLNEEVQGFSVIPEATFESDSCFAIYHQSNEYLESKKTEDMSIGYGPVIVSKSSGELFQTGSGRFVDDSIKSFEKYGNPFLEKNTSIINLSFSKGENFDSLTILKLVKKVTGKGVFEAKQIAQKIINGGMIELDNKFNYETLEQLKKQGFLIDHPWKN